MSFGTHGPDVEDLGSGGCGYIINGIRKSKLLTFVFKIEFVCGVLLAQNFICLLISHVPLIEIFFCFNCFSRFEFLKYNTVACNWIPFHSFTHKPQKTPNAR